VVEVASRRRIGSEVRFEVGGAGSPNSLPARASASRASEVGRVVVTALSAASSPQSFASLSAIE